MPSKSAMGDTAIVAGAGVGGLFAAGALRRHFREVILIERDSLPAESDFRKGVPQGPHGHAVLKRGENIAESLFPGFRDALKKAGGVEFDLDRDAARHDFGDWRKPANSGLKIFSQSRALLEHVLRQCARACDNVVIRENATVTGYLTSGGALTGVTLQTGQGKVEELRADLVVEATGRSGTLPEWLSKNGFGAVPDEKLGINLVYVTGIFATDSFEDGKPLLCTLREAPPKVRGGTAMPIEGKRWMVTLSGRQGDVPPIDLDGFREFAKSLPDSTVYERLCNGRLEGRLQRFIIAESYWRHYEKMAQFPERLIPLGDAVAGFNPVFGQGMSAAAVDAEHLRIVLDQRAEAGAGLNGLSKDYFPRIAEAVGAAWNGTATYDLMFESTQGIRPDDYPQRRAAFLAMQELAADDAELRRRQTLIGNMLEPPSSLYTPELLTRLQAHLAAKAGKAS